MDYAGPDHHGSRCGGPAKLRASAMASTHGGLYSE